MQEILLNPQHHCSSLFQFGELLRNKEAYLPEKTRCRLAWLIRILWFKLGPFYSLNFYKVPVSGKVARAPYYINVYTDELIDIIQAKTPEFAPYKLISFK